MKKSKYIFWFIVLLTIYACEDFLDVAPKGQVEIETFYNTLEECNIALNSVYGSLQEKGTYNDSEMHMFCTDVTKPAFWKKDGGFYNYSISAENKPLETIWADHYTGINQANLVISKTLGVELGDDADMNDSIEQFRIINEARYLRTILYFNLVRIFKSVPLITNPTDPSSGAKDLMISQVAEDSIYQFLISEAETCSKHLKSKGEINHGHATVEAAWALLADVNLTWASRIKYLEQKKSKAEIAPEESKIFYERALAYSDSIINSGKYSLVNYYPDVFTSNNENNDEIIFDVQFKSKLGTEGSQVGINIGLGGFKEYGGSYGSVISTVDYPSQFSAGDIRKDWNTVHGLLLDETQKLRSYQESSKKAELTVKGERLRLIIWTDAADHQEYKIGKWRRWPTYSNDYVADDGDLNWVVYRLAEIYLFYAEAFLELNGYWDERSLNLLNKLRERAWVGTVKDIHLNAVPRQLVNHTLTDQIKDLGTKTNADVLRKERALELGAELKRWFDLVRWGMLQQRIRELAVRNGTVLENGRGEPLEGFEWGDKNIQDFHNYMPIPYSEILANDSLVQNVGYY